MGKWEYFDDGLLNKYVTKEYVVGTRLKKARETFANHKFKVVFKPVIKWYIVSKKK